MQSGKEKKLNEIKNFFEVISPIIINPGKTSLTIGISRRFFLFDLIQKLTKRIEDDPYLNFISVLKHYKVIGKFLHGDIHEFYRDRNKSYFKRFFIDEEIYQAIKQDIEWVYKRNDSVKLTITKRGVIVYDNYRQNSFNILLLTPHSGECLPKDIKELQVLTNKERKIDEDTYSHKLYADLVLKKNGIWIDTKLSRFACDYNRSPERAIYENSSEVWFDQLWKEPLENSHRAWLMEGYEQFYFTLSQLIDTYRFNIIFDGHTMRDTPSRSEVSFGTEHIPAFYMPVVRSMRAKMSKLGYGVSFNSPFGGGHILQWLKDRFPDVFICSLEINKKLYMNKDYSKVYEEKMEKLSDDLTQIFDIEDDTEE